jgi:hypothetical protein
MPTLKQQMVINKLPENGYNIGKTMRQVGYTYQTSRDGSTYARLRKHIEKAYNPEQIKADIRKAEKDFEKDKDNSNRARMLELRAKVSGLTKDNTQVNANIIGDEAIKGIIDRAGVKSIDPSQAQTEGINPVKQDTFKTDITQPIDNTTLTDKS